MTDAQVVAIIAALIRENANRGNITTEDAVQYARAYLAEAQQQMQYFRSVPAPSTGGSDA